MRGQPPGVGVPAVLRGPRRPDLLRNETLPEIFSSTAVRCSGRPALIWGQQVLSYGELDSVSDALGAALGRRGATAGQVIGLFLPRGADLLIAQLAITKSGAAWLPFDAETPMERVRTCLQSAGARGLVTCRSYLPRLSGLSIPVWALEDLKADISETLPRSLPRPDDPAYVIYTSGSTGIPKGIVISHRSICHFLRSENELLGVREEDRVYQGFSVAFDMSFEEIWISYLVGATLWIAPPSVIGDPDSLAQAIVRERITVLHAVPTLLGLVEAPLPNVRLINLGGEACPDALAQRLVRPGLRVFNTYGPTETSVSASLAELKTGERVTIGMPLPNYGMLVVDEQLRPLPADEVGELCIFGPGLSAGYLGQPELTAQRFITNPFAANPDEARMYLTGDLARFEPQGPVHCLGRTDHQVKIRGFRVELGEIVAALQAQPGVAAAAVAMRAVAENDELIGYVVPTVGSRPDPGQLQQALGAQLPRYMVPAHVQIVTDLPRLTSGKIDQRALCALPLDITALSPGTSTVPRNDDEAALFAALGKILPGRALRPEADFFDDLGGHSLLVARLVSRLRADQRFATLSVQDVYRERKLGGIAHVMARLRQQQSQTHPKPRSRAVVPPMRRWLCGLAQAAVVPFFVMLNIADWLAPFFTYHYFTGDETDSISLAVVYSLGVFVLARLLNVAVAIGGKRLITGKLRAGRYPLWGLTYFRWWLAGRFAELPDVYLLASTPWMNLYLRALGTHVGRDVMIDTITIGAPELLVIEDGVSIGTFVNIENARVEGGELILGPVLLKREATVESYAVLEEGTEVGTHAQLCGQSALAAGEKIPDGEIWDGAPARASIRVATPLPPRPKVGFTHQWMQATIFAVTAMVVSVLFFLPTFPTFMLIDWIDAHWVDIFDSEAGPLAAFGYVFLLAIPASALFVSFTMLVTAGMRWIMPRQRAGIFPVHSVAFWRKKFMGQILDGSLHELHGLFASVYAPLWLRFLGVNVGNNSEVSTAEGIVPELLQLGSDCFIADGAMLGDEEQRHGWMILQPTSIGNRSFIGNGAYVPDGANVPDDVLIGVQTRTPTNAQLKSGQTWLGSPPLLLPAREQVGGFPDTLTFHPPPMRRLGRALVEGLRIVLPLALVIASGYLIVILVLPLAAEQGWGLQVGLALAVAGCIYGLASFLFVVAAKWLLVGRYHPRAAPMWTPFVWISEAVTNIYESLAVPNLLNGLRGTPMLPWALRLLGAHIGRGVFLNTTDLTEFDCVRIGDESELNAWCGPQTHLFEDRVMKIGLVEIGAQVTVGARSTVLYDTNIGDGVRLGPLTLVAKGERLPGATRWTGSPAASVPEK